jgi:uncharacterized membrane protein
MATERMRGFASAPIALARAGWAISHPLEGWRVGLWAVGVAVVLVLVGAPLVGRPRVVRLPAVLVPAMVLGAVVARPRRVRELARRAMYWQPSARTVRTAALVAGSLLFWYVLTRFQSGEINAIDFTIYYDRPCFQTANGRPLFVEHSDTPGFSQRSELADHAYWGMLAVCAAYAVQPTPLWLHALSAIAVVAGAVYVLRIMQGLGAGGALAGATALAFILNDNTARTLNYGFHPEVLYAWFVPWMIHAGLRAAPGSFLAATFATVLVKEDAVLPIFAVSVALALTRYRVMSRAQRGLYLVFPTVLALGNLAVYYGLAMPMLSGDTRPTYAHFWGNYGATPLLALLGMLAHPGRVLAGTMSSGVFRTLLPHLFLPLVGWRWALGLVPIVAIYAASANDQVRAFGIYYAILLVPFLVIAASWGARSVARRVIAGTPRAEFAAAAVVLLAALLVGSGNRGYSLRPWRHEVAAVPEALARLRDEPLVLVQSGLFPHAGYDERHALLTAETLDDPRNAGAVVLIAPGVGAYPFKAKALAAGLGHLPEARPMPAGLVALRLPESAGSCGDPLGARLPRSRPPGCR